MESPVNGCVRGGYNAPVLLDLFDGHENNRSIEMGFFSNLFRGNRTPDLEDEFYNLMQSQAFEMMGMGVSPTEVPKLATNKAAEILMMKYAIPMESMVKIIERAMRRHQ